MHQQVSVACGQRFLAAAEPDQKYRRKGHDLPEKEERQVVAAEDDPQRSRHVNPGSGLLQRVFHMQPVDRADNAHERHDVGKDHAQGVHPAENHCGVHKAQASEHAIVTLHAHHVRKGQQGHHNQEDLAPRLGQTGQNDGSSQQDGRGMNPGINHHSSPRGS